MCKDSDSLALPINQNYISSLDARKQLMLLDVLQRHIANATYMAEWSLVWQDDENPSWVVARHACESKLLQGWKLHLSASIASWETVLRQALPILLTETASFKVVASIEWLRELNNGLAGYSQIGKFVTVYPNDDEQAVRLAVALDTVTRGLRGPDVPSDRRLAPGSLVYYRYGGFTDLTVTHHDGTALPAIAAPNGRLIPDLREPGNYAPPWATDPFVAAGVAVPLPELSPILAGRYLIVETIAGSARGTVARGIDLNGPQTCILKRAARDAQMDVCGRDARDRLQHGVEILDRFRSDARFPTMIDLFPYNDDLILVLNDLPGRTLARYMKQRLADRNPLAEPEILDLARQLAMLLMTIHDNGIVHCDLKPTNLIISADGNLSLIDFDAAYDTRGAATPEHIGTIGYMSPQQSAGVTPMFSDDLYSFGAVCSFLATGENPPSQLDHMLSTETFLHEVHGLTLKLADLIVRCLNPDPSGRFDSASELIEVLDALMHT